MTLFYHYCLYRAILYCMAFFEDIKRHAPHLGDISIREQIQFVNRSLLIVSGHKGVLMFLDNEIKIRLKDCSLHVTGAALTIIYLSKSDLYIGGDISGIQFYE